MLSFWLPSRSNTAMLIKARRYPAIAILAVGLVGCGIWIALSSQRNDAPHPASRSSHAEQGVTHVAPQPERVERTDAVPPSIDAVPLCDQAGPLASSQVSYVADVLSRSAKANLDGLKAPLSEQDIKYPMSRLAREAQNRLDYEKLTIAAVMVGKGRYYLVPIGEAYPPLPSMHYIVSTGPVPSNRGTAEVVVHVPGDTPSLQQCVYQLNQLLEAADVEYMGVFNNRSYEDRAASFAASRQASLDITRIRNDTTLGSSEIAQRVRPLESILIRDGFDIDNASFLLRRRK